MVGDRRIPPNDRLRSPHADELVRAPGPQVGELGLADLPHARVRVLARRGHERSADDLPLAGLVIESIADLELHREDVVGWKSDLQPWVPWSRCGSVPSARSPR